MTAEDAMHRIWNQLLEQTERLADGTLPGAVDVAARAVERDEVEIRDALTIAFGAGVHFAKNSAGDPPHPDGADGS